VINSRLLSKYEFGENRCSENRNLRTRKGHKCAFFSSFSALLPDFYKVVTCDLHYLGATCNLILAKCHKGLLLEPNSANIFIALILSVIEGSRGHLGNGKEPREFLIYA
jgi:hypothetical protein